MKELGVFYSVETGTATEAGETMAGVGGQDPVRSPQGKEVDHDLN